VAFRRHYQELLAPGAPSGECAKEMR